MMLLMLRLYVKQYNDPICALYLIKILNSKMYKVYIECEANWLLEEPRKEIRLEVYY